MSGINFLRNQQVKIKQQARKQMFIQLSAFSLLGCFGLVVCLIFAYYFILQGKSKSLDASISDQQSNIENLVGVETKQFYLKQKASNLEEIFEESRDHQAIVEGLFGIIPQGIEIGNFAISGENSLALSGSSDNFTLLDTLLNNIKKGSIGTQKVDIASVTQVTLKEKKGYDFNISITLK